MSSLRRIARTAFPCIVLPSIVSVCHAQQPVGKLSVIRQVQVTNAPFAQDNNFVDATDGQTVLNNYGLRTKRRSQAVINFKTGSQLRVNENTEMKILNAESLQHVQLFQGAVWVKVAKGVNTSISTLTTTATARGTEFEVFANGDVFVFEGSVEVTIGGHTVLVTAGNKLIASSGDSSTPTPGNGTGDGTSTPPSGTPPASTPPDSTGTPPSPPLTPVPLSPTETPIGRGGSTATWFTNVPQDSGIVVGNSGSDFQKTRTNPLSETAPKGTKGGLVVVVRSVRRPYIVTTTDPRNELGLLDDTNTSYLIPAVALVGSLAVDRNDLREIKMPAITKTLFGFVGDPAFAGVRGEATGLVGNSRYVYEANILQFYNDPQSNLLGRFGSVLELERMVGTDITVFAGRRKFYEGPVFSDAIDTQLIADRFSAAGLRYVKNALTVETAYLYDGNRYLTGVQPGYLASGTYKLYGGLLGAHLLETTGIPGAGHGRSLSFTMPIRRNIVDGYGEFGTGVDGSQNETFGLGLPGLFQQTGVNVFLEYARKETISQSYSVTGLYEVPKGPQLRGSIDWINATPRASIGAALRF